MGFLSWICKVLMWFASPHVTLWAGAVAAIIAALTVETKTWLKSPLNSLGRSLRVTVIWLVIAWMLSSAVRLGSGRGSGEGEGNGSGTGSANGVMPPVAIVPGQFASGTPEHVDLVVTFVASAGKQTVAQEFSCDLHQKITEKKATKIEIRARDMREFDKLLVQQLRGVNLPQAPKLQTVLIKRTPFPGESVVRRVTDKVLEVFPKATVEFDE